MVSSSTCSKDVFSSILAHLVDLTISMVFNMQQSCDFIFVGATSSRSIDYVIFFRLAVLLAYLVVVVSFFPVADSCSVDMFSIVLQRHVLQTNFVVQRIGVEETESLPSCYMLSDAYAVLIIFSFHDLVSALNAIGDVFLIRKRVFSSVCPTVNTNGFTRFLSTSYFRYYLTTFFFTKKGIVETNEILSEKILRDEVTVINASRVSAAFLSIVDCSLTTKESKVHRFLAVLVSLPIYIRSRELRTKRPCVLFAAFTSLFTTATKIVYGWL